MSVQDETNDQLAAGIGSRLREAEKRAKDQGHLLLHALLKLAHTNLDIVQRHAHREGLVTTLDEPNPTVGGTDKETP